MRFDILWRKAGTDAGAGDTPICRFDNRFVRRVPGGFLATPFAADVIAPAPAADAGDQLVLRITTTGGDPGVLYVPNGDGARAMGEIPHIDLPPP